MTSVHDVIERLSCPAHNRYYMLTVNLRPIYELIPDPIEGLTDELARCVIQYANRKGWLYTQASDDFAATVSSKQNSPIDVFVLAPEVLIIIIDMHQYSTFGAIADIKLEIIGRINRYFPAEMTKVDQRRVFSTLDIGQSRSRGIERLQTIGQYLVRRSKAADDAALTGPADVVGHSLCLADAPAESILCARHIQYLEAEFDLLGVDGFFAALVATQRMAYTDEAGTFRSFAREVHTNLKAVKRFFLPKVQSWGRHGEFDQMTSLFDGFLLRSLAGHSDSLAKPTSINLNVQSLLSDDFTRFHKHHGANFRNLIIELRLHDVVANLDAYLHSKNRLEPDGVKFCIDWLDPRQLKLLNIGGLEADLVKIPCSFDPNESQERLRDILSLQARGWTAVMMHIDHDDYVRIGRDLGVRIFQGHAVDRKLLTSEGKQAGTHLTEIDGIRRDIVAWSSFLHYSGGRRRTDCEARAQADLKDARQALHTLQEQVETADELRMIHALTGRVRALEAALFAPSHRPVNRRTHRLPAAASQESRLERLSA